MRRKLTALAALAATAVIVAAVAAAGPAAAKQRVAIQSKGANGFVLTPLSRGAIKLDAGSVGFCCWSSRVVMREGQRIEVTTGPQMTIVGKRGTLVASNRMEWLDVADGVAVFTGTWKVVHGTGDYAQLSGGGRVAGFILRNGEVTWRREGFLSPS